MPNALDASLTLGNLKKSGKSTLSSTIKIHDSNGRGIGSTLEIFSVSSRLTNETTSLQMTGFCQAILDTGLQVDLQEETSNDADEVQHHGHGYITVSIKSKSLQRIQLNDLLHGQGWKLISNCVYEKSENEIHILEKWAKSLQKK